MTRSAVAVTAVLAVLGLACTPGPATRSTLPPAVITFPDAATLVPDPAQLTGVRMSLPLPDCVRRPSDCNEIRLLNQLDGFDLDPRVTLQLAEPLPFDPAELGVQADGDVLWIGQEGTSERISLNRFVYEPRNRILAAHPREQLREGTRYRLVYQVPDRPPVSVGFVTHSATAGVRQLRAQLDDGSAYEDARIPPAQRGLRVGEVLNGSAALTRYADVGAKGPCCGRASGVLRASPVLNPLRGAAARLVFGSLSAPLWLNTDTTIPVTPTGTRGPRVTGRAELGVLVVVPPGLPPPQGWPVAIFGTGLGGSRLDVLLAAQSNAARRLATVATDPVGHGFGPRGQLGIATPLGEVRVPAFGRGSDRDGDGEIGSSEGASAPLQPHPQAAVGLRDALRQTAADQMVLARAVRQGVDLDGDRLPDLRRDRIGYVGVSLGSIYGAMAVAADPLLEVAVLNVGGGPVADIARLSPTFRPQVAQGLRARRPALLNGGSDGFTESLPLFDEEPVGDPVPGALPIQETLARQAWLQRSASPEAFAARLPRGRVLLQVAWGDRTLPNPASATVIRAGGLRDRTSLYHNDRTLSATLDPHGLLLNPLIEGRDQAQDQASSFLLSRGRMFVDPDGEGTVWESPLTDLRGLERLNFEPPGR